MKNNDTIAAISTAVGVSAISIVRVCGDLALQIALQITQSQRLRPRFAYLKSLYDENKNLIDRGIVIYFKAPHSFNGLDIVEFQCHGGIALPNKILETCLAMGARMARPGEFSKLALLNNKLDLSQLENIAQLINAQNAQSLNIIAKNLRGDLGAIVETFRDKLLGILAHSEALIDYAEDEISNDLSAKIEKLKRDLEAILAHSKTMQNVINGHKLAIIGRPNVGKSSILNRLLLQNRAIVSETPGTTRDSIEAQITLGGQILTIIDTAGIREIGGDSSKDSRDLKDSRESLESHAHIEWLGIKKSREIVREASIILAVFDNSRVFSLREDGAIVELLRQNSDKIIIVAINKCDKAQSLDLSHFRDFEAILISAKNDSIFTLRDKIAQKIALNPKNGDEIILSTKRQIQCVEIALNALQNAQNMQDDFELFSFHINEALRALALISKPYNYDEMLDKMFGEFCLGK